MNEVCEELMEIAIRARAGGYRCSTVSEDALVGRKPVALRVAQHIAPVKLVQGKSARSSGEPHRARLEQLLQLLHHAKDADLLMLPEVIHVSDRHDPLGGDGLVVGFDSRRNTGDA